ncbi:MAG: dipeptidyl aminopeptidase/acylaminoacyl peptidase [Bacteroidia bacterium]
MSIVNRTSNTNPIFDVMKVPHLIIALLLFTNVDAQEQLEYQKPPQEILDLVDVKRPPTAIFTSKKDYMLLLYRESYKSIAELSQEELRLAGLRIDPKTNIGSRTTFYTSIEVSVVSGKTKKPIATVGLPTNPKLSNFSWSPDESYMAFTHTTTTGNELWLLDIKANKVKKLTEGILNANMYGAITWSRDSKHLIIKTIPDTRKALIDTKNVVPTGPIISTNNGKKAQNRTYQDLLKNKNDEFNFQQLATSELIKITTDGKMSKWLDADMYTRIQFSPDGTYVMVGTIQKPFSYIVTYGRFPSTTNVYKQAGDLVQTVSKVPLIEDLPKGFMSARQGKRSFTWRADKPATLVYAEALDKGDPAIEVPFRDEVFELTAPFDGQARSICKTINRYSGITWGNDHTAVVSDYWWNNRNTKTYLIDPSTSNPNPTILFDRNYQDRYSNPGSITMEKGAYGRYVMTIDNGNVFLLGPGYSKKGQFPFLDQFNLQTRTKSRLFQSNLTNKLENLYSYDHKTKELLVRIESANEYPNYYKRPVNNAKSLTQLTFFENPFTSIENVDKRILKYKRADGLELSGTLYLPVGYDTTAKEKVPLIIWAYPREYKDKSSASQSTGNSNKFTYPFYGSMIYWVTQGYAVLDGASFPIVGEGKNEPNDDFRKQLVANAKAAIDAVDSLGYIDRKRVAVGGHSYGAFMVANLLSHSNLFAAGIARSGAYNRTLTPFGFQSEERSYWDAPDVYNTMSPFMHANKMKTPLLLIHGEADNNSGTYPLQSERYFNALKGLGAPVRLVILPKESHGYAAKESILHLLWEQHQWLEDNVKNKK